MVKILNKCILSTLVYNLYLDRIFPYTGILAVFMKLKKKIQKKHSYLIGGNNRVRHLDREWIYTGKIIAG